MIDLDREEFDELVRRAFDLYPRQNPPSEDLLDAWFTKLKRYSLEQVERGLDVATDRCKTTPSHAHVLEAIKEKATSADAPESERCAWVAGNLRCKHVGHYPLHDNDPEGPRLCEACHFSKTDEERAARIRQQYAGDDGAMPLPPFNDALIIQDMLVRQKDRDMATQCYGTQKVSLIQGLIDTHGSIDGPYKVAKQHQHGSSGRRVGPVTPRGRPLLPSNPGQQQAASQLEDLPI